MCSQSVSGSSLLSGYDEDDARETSGRSRREFDQIDAVLYLEEPPKRSSIKRICDEWSSKPHFRIRGRQTSIYSEKNLARFEPLIPMNTSLTSSFELQSNNFKVPSLNSNELNVSSISLTNNIKRVTMEIIFGLWICLFSTDLLDF